LSYLLKNEHDDGRASSFIKIIKNIGLTSFAYQQSNSLFFSLQHLFGTNKHFIEEDIGILPFNTGKVGGGLLFVMKKGKSHSTMENVLQSLQDAGKYVSLDYASWRDGYASDGVHLEQHISKEVFSEYTKERNITFSDSVGKYYF